MRALPSNVFAASSVASRMFHIAFDLRASYLALMFRALRASSIVSLLTAIKLRVDKSSWPEMNDTPLSDPCNKLGAFGGFSATHADGAG